MGTAGGGGPAQTEAGLYGSDTHWEQYIGFHVVDTNEEVIGKLSALWTDDAGQPAYLGVRTGWFGKNHVFPANAADVDAARERIRVPFSIDSVREAPTFASDEELTESDQGSIREYFGAFGYQRSEEPIPRTSADQPHLDAPAGDASLKLSEEQIKVGKREVEAGGVRLRKVVRTETVNQPVELKREEVVVERVPGSEATGRAQHEFEQHEVYVPLRREEAVVEKESRVREEVRVRKNARSDTQNVSEQVRKEDVEIEREGEAREGGECR